MYFYLYRKSYHYSVYSKKLVSWVWCQTASDGKSPVLEIWGNVQNPFIAITPRPTLASTVSIG